MKQILICFFALAVLFLSYSLPAFAQEATTVTIMNFTNRSTTGEWQWLSKGLADMLITDLSNCSEIQVVERERMQKLFEEMALTTTGIIDEATAAKFGKVARVDKALFGSFLKEGDSLSIEAHIIDVAAGELVRVEWVRGKAEDVFKLEKQLAFKIIKNLHVKLTKAERESIRYIPTDNIDASEHFYLGIDLYDRGDYTQAWVECRGALGKDNEFIKAAYWVGKLYADLGEINHAELAYRTVLDKFPGERVPGNILLDIGNFFDSVIKSPETAILVYERIIAKHSDQSISREDLDRFRVNLKRRPGGDIRYEKFGGERFYFRGLHPFTFQINAQPKVYGKALFRASSLYEKLGDDIKACQLLYRLYHDLSAQIPSFEADRGLYRLYTRFLDKGEENVVKIPLEVSIFDLENPVFAKRYKTGTQAKGSARYSLAKRGGHLMDQVLLQAPRGYSIASIAVKLAVNPEHLSRNFSFEIMEFPHYKNGYLRRLLWLTKSRDDLWRDNIRDAYVTTEKVTNGKSEMPMPRNIRLVEVSVNVSNASGLEGWEVTAELAPFAPPEAIQRSSPRVISSQTDTTESQQAEIRVYHPSSISLLDADWLKDKRSGSSAKQWWILFFNFDGQRSKTRRIVCLPGKHTIELRACLNQSYPTERNWLEKQSFVLKDCQITVEPGEKKEIWLSPFDDLGPPYKLSETGVNPRLFEDKRGKIWAFWEKDITGEISQMWFCFSEDGGNNWSKPQKVSVSSGYLDWNASFAQDSSGTYWLAWMSNRDRKNMNAIYISKSSDGVTWNFPRRVHITRYPSPKHNYSPWPGIDLLIDRNGRFLLAVENFCLISRDGLQWDKHIVGKQSQGRPRIIQTKSGRYVKIDGSLFSTSRDGADWAEEKKVLHGSDPEGGGGILEDKNGHLIAFKEGFYTTSADGKNWSNPVNLPSFHIDQIRVRLSASSIAQSRDGHFFVLWSARDMPRWTISKGIYVSKGTYLRNPDDIIGELEKHRNTNIRENQ